MNIHERLKHLRKQLNLTTRAFGAAIDMSGGAITNMEKGTRNITERTIRDICREYGVNSDWLINGNEPIFEDITKELDIDDDVRQLAKQYNLLNDADKELIKKMIISLTEKAEKPNFNIAVDVNQSTMQQKQPFSILESPEKSKREEWERQADEFAAMARAQFLQEKKRESQASSAPQSDAG